MIRGIGCWPCVLLLASGCAGDGLAHSIDAASDVPQDALTDVRGEALPGADAGPEGSAGGDATADAATACVRDEDCPPGPFCAGILRCGPGGRCGYFLVRLPCNDDQRCTDDVCDEASHSCSFVPHSERCPAGSTCLAYRGCVGADGGT